jgi:hypothetical protein
MEDKSDSLSEDESFSDSGNAWGRDNRYSKWCRHVVTDFFRWRNRGTLVTAAHTRLSTSAARVLPVGGREEDFSLAGDSGQKPGRASGGAGPCQFAARAEGTRWDAMHATSSCLRMRLKPAPSGLTYSNRLNFFRAAYNELLALLSRDLRASEWLCA